MSGSWTFTWTGGHEAAVTSLATNPTLLAAAVAALAAVVAAVLGFFGVWIANVITGKLKDQELYLKALEFLKGGTQNRAIGIAIMIDYAENNDKRKKVVATIFRAQMFHLVKGGDTVTPYKDPIEAFNYLVMQKTLIKWGAKVPVIVSAAATLVETNK